MVDFYSRQIGPLVILTKLPPSKPSTDFDIEDEEEETSRASAHLEESADNIDARGAGLNGGVGVYLAPSGADGYDFEIDEDEDDDGAGSFQATFSAPAAPSNFEHRSSRNSYGSSASSPRRPLGPPPPASPSPPPPPPTRTAAAMRTTATTLPPQQQQLPRSRSGPAGVQSPAAQRAAAVLARSRSTPPRRQGPAESPPDNSDDYDDYEESGESLGNGNSAIAVVALQSSYKGRGGRTVSLAPAPAPATASAPLPSSPPPRAPWSAPVPADAPEAIEDGEGDGDGDGGINDKTVNGSQLEEEEWDDYVPDEMVSVSRSLAAGGGPSSIWAPAPVPSLTQTLAPPRRPTAKYAV